MVRFIQVPAAPGKGSLRYKQSYYVLTYIYLKLGPCVQDLLDAGVVERVNSDNVEGHADEYSAIMGGTYSDPIDVVCASVLLHVYIS